jgi:hypothetical protein
MFPHLDVHLIPSESEAYDQLGGVLLNPLVERQSTMKSLAPPGLEERWGSAPSATS